MPVKINGTTSGSVTLAAPATGSDVTLTLPGSTGTVALTTGAGLQFITSQDFSAVSSVSVNNCFTSTYDVYKLFVNLSAQSATATNVSIRMRTAGSDNSSSNYYFNGTEVATSSATTVGTSRSIGTGTRFIAGSYVANPGGYDITFIGPFLTQKTMLLSHSVAVGDTDMMTRTLAGLMTVTTSYESFTLYPDSGTISGSLRVYGLRNS